MDICGQKREEEEKEILFNLKAMDQTIKLRPIDLIFCYVTLLNISNHNVVLDLNFNGQTIADLRYGVLYPNTLFYYFS